MRPLLTTIAVLTASALGSCADGVDEPAPRGVTLEPSLAARLTAEAGSSIDLSKVLLAGAAGDETVVVVEREASQTERAGGGHAAQLWIALGDKPFRLAADYLSYDFACKNIDPVCPRARPGGLGFAAVRQQPGGRTFVLVGATRDRPVRVTTAEGKVHEVGVAPDGAIVEVTTAKPWETRIQATLPGGESYDLMLPPFGVVST
ncbi:MAG TPA: hypothetical protein VFC19_13225 [Candidatus Limnocylindrales bacterium]|nr:hypothetical protein [Candidatus Limnocylindrales bacterium]